MFDCNSSRLIAAYHVLHRLLLPRHPPCALISLNLYLRDKYFYLSANSTKKFIRISSKIIFFNLVSHHYYYYVVSNVQSLDNEEHYQ